MLQGGVKAVVWTDVVQAFVMIFAMLVVFILAVQRVGGVSEVVERAIAGNRLTMMTYVRSLYWYCIKYLLSYIWIYFYKTVTNLI